MSKDFRGANNVIVPTSAPVPRCRRSVRAHLTATSRRTGSYCIAMRQRRREKESMPPPRLWFELTIGRAAAATELIVFAALFSYSCFVAPLARPLAIPASKKHRIRHACYYRYEAGQAAAADGGCGRRWWGEHDRCRLWEVRSPLAQRRSTPSHHNTYYCLSSTMPAAAAFLFITLSSTVIVLLASPIKWPEFSVWRKPLCLPCKNGTSQRKKAGGNVTTHAQHRIIYFCIIYAMSLQ